MNNAGASPSEPGRARGAHAFLGSTGWARLSTPTHLAGDVPLRADEHRWPSPRGAAPPDSPRGSCRLAGLRVLSLPVPPASRCSHSPPPKSIPRKTLSLCIPKEGIRKQRHRCAPKLHHYFSILKPSGRLTADAAWGRAGSTPTPARAPRQMHREEQVL